jgi:HK97 family phage major capsid protein
MEIAGNDPAPEAEVRDMLSAASYLPTQVGTELIRLVEGYSKFMMRSGRVTGTGRTYIMPREAVKMTAGIIAENTSVINSSAQLDTVTMTALNAWSGERVPNRALADSPVSVAGILVRQAGEALATLYDNEFVNGTNVTSGLEDVTTASTTLQDDDIGETTASLYTNQIATQFFDLAEGARANATWVVNETYAKNLSKICGSDDRPIFQFLNDPPAPVFDGAQPGQLFGRPVIVHSAVGADYAYFGDLRRAVMTYMRQGIVAESSRDAEFALDNTLFRFGMRFDIALVEEGQINEHPNA